MLAVCAAELLICRLLGIFNCITIVQCNAWLGILLRTRILQIWFYHDPSAVEYNHNKFSKLLLHSSGWTWCNLSYVGCSRIC